ncbi:serine hydrolase domain-containing protein [Lacticaseibacillus sharpeae]|nr:serine hydrolase domain-containing protein [Lacticaseibacillus sharpeae]
MNELEQINRMAAMVDGPLRHMVSSGVTPGVSYAVIAGKRSYSEYFGNAQIKPTTVPLTANMYYDLASLTKVIGTTPLLLQAVRAGLLQLDQEVRTVLPTFSGGDLTFRELMTHTSGLEGYIPHRDELPPDQLQRALTTQLHVGADRGHVAVYRDFNLLLTGWALEKVYGNVPIQQIITQRVLTPWGIQATFAPDAAASVPTSYTPAAGLRRGVVHDPKSAILGAHSGAAGMFATLPGLVRYVQIAFGNIAQTALAPDWSRQLQRDYTAGQHRSIGYNLRYQAGNPRPWLYHTGYTGTFILFDPTQQLGLIVLSNRVHPYVHEGFLAQRDALIAKFLN